jgi:RHS repeat-associated protein
MGCPRLKTENWVFLRGGEKHLLFPRNPREKNRSRSAPAEMDDECPFLFSSEYLDSETGLVYYNYRYYSPELGRWTKRDPIEEDGGFNLYGMVGNDPVGRGDYLGLRDDLVILPPKRTKNKAEQLIIQYWEYQKAKCEDTDDTITLIYVEDVHDARGQILTFDKKDFDRVVVTGHANEGYQRTGGTKLGPGNQQFKRFLLLLIEYTKTTAIIRYEGCYAGKGEAGKKLIEETVKITKLSTEAYTGRTTRGTGEQRGKEFNNPGELLRGTMDGDKVKIEKIIGEARKKAELK